MGRVTFSDNKGTWFRYFGPHVSGQRGAQQNGGRQLPSIVLKKRRMQPVDSRNPALLCSGFFALYICCQVMYIHRVGWINIPVMVALMPGNRQKGTKPGR